MKRIFTIHLFLMLATTILFAQQNPDVEKLKIKVNENSALLKTNSEKALIEAKTLEKEANQLNAPELELEIIVNQFNHYKRNNDFKNMLATANLIYQKAETYKMPLHQVMAKRYLFDAYIFSGLPDEAFPQLEEGLRIMNKTEAKDSLSIMTKANLFIGYSNYYLYEKDYENQLKYLKLSGNEAQKLPNGIHKQRWLQTYYANIGMAFKHFNLDSAKYYAQLSLSKNLEQNNSIKAMNLSVLGEVAMKESNYQNALNYFKNAEKLQRFNNYMNTEDLFRNLKEVYQKLEKKDSVKIYQSKIDSLNLSISQNQNQSLHKLLNEKTENDYKIYFYIFGFALIILIGIIVLVVRKTRILAGQEKVSQQYLDKVSENPKGEDYTKLLEMLKKNDPAFMFYFDETFPEFSSKLEKINPKISSTEIEFCALLKLKLPTKDIAKYQYIEPQSVRNKKHLIRKKLTIPKDRDIYEFIDEI